MIAPALPGAWSPVELTARDLAAHVVTAVEASAHQRAPGRVQGCRANPLPKRAVGEVRVRRPILPDAAALVLLQRVDRAGHEDREALEAAGAAVESREHEAGRIAVGRGGVVVRRSRSAED